MRHIIFAVLLTLGTAASAWADGFPQLVRSDTSTPWTKTVFNDSGGTLVHGQIVVWDTDDTEYDRNGYPYVTTTTSADDIDTAGVMLTSSCPDQQLCEIVVKGWAATDIPTGLTEDTLISTGTTAGRAADSTAGNNVCYLGVLRENIHLPTAATCTAGSVHCAAPVEVNIVCVP